MAYVAPNSTIKLLSRVPITNNYEESTWYVGREAQLADFEQYVKYTLNEYSYQRHGRNYIRVSIPEATLQNPLPNNNVADDLFDVNYMIFQNTNFGRKWFYAFVTDVEYVNNSCAELTYEIDVIQTFQFDYTMPLTYVDREHSATDAIGDNLVDEDINTGELVPYNNFKYELNYNFEEVSIVILYIRNEAKMNLINTDPDDVNFEYFQTNYPVDGGNFFNRIFSACDYSVVSGSIYSATDITNMRNRIRTAISTIQARFCTIVAMLEIPSSVLIRGGLVSGQAWNYNVPITITSTPMYIYGNINRPSAFRFDRDPLGSYTNIKNNKLFTYPFNELQISNREGNVKSYRYEYFNTSNMRVCLSIATVPMFEHVLFPLGYLYSTQGQQILSDDPNYYVSGAPLPLPTYSEDSYRMWQAQKSSTVTMDAVGSLIKGAILALGTYYTAGTATPALYASLGATALSSAGSVISSSISAKNAPDVYHGSTTSSDILCGLENKGFDIKMMQVKPTVAKQIDDYFTAYGYACKQIKRPSLFTNPRPYWHYTRTIGCNVHPTAGTLTSGIPCDYIKKINDIYDKGIRYWMTTLRNVDNYTLDNSPAT